MLSGGTWIASDYVQPRIGTDLALLTGIAKALVESATINHDFIAGHTENFAAYQEDLRNTDWDTLTASCGIDRARIEHLATCYARAEHAVFAWGMGITHHLHGVENVEAIANLALLRGMIGKPAAGLLPLRGHSNVQGIGTIGVKPVLPEDVFQQLEQTLGIQLPTTAGMDTLACLNAAHEGAIDAALLMGGNLFSATPNANWARTALDRIGFKTFMTTTLNRGHVTGMETSEALILPVTARDEEWQSTTQESMFNYVRLSDGGIRRLENIRPEVTILCEFGKRLLPNCLLDFDEFQQHQKIRSAIAATIPGMEALADIGTTGQEFTISKRLLHTPEFPTPTGKAEFKINPLAAPLTTTEFPFVMASIRSEGQFNSIIYEETDSYRGTNTRWSVLMNIEDITELGISAGDYVTLRSPFGEMQAVKVFAFEVPRKNLLAYYPEANVLIGTAHDPRSKTPAFKSVAIAVECA